MSPIQIAHEKMQRRHLARLRKSVGVTGLELPEDEREASSALIVILCAVGMVAAWVIGMVLS